MSKSDMDLKYTIGMFEEGPPEDFPSAVDYTSACCVRITNRDDDGISWLDLNFTPDLFAEDRDRNQTVFIHFLCLCIWMGFSDRLGEFIVAAQNDLVDKDDVLPTGFSDRMFVWEKDKSLTAVSNEEDITEKNMSLSDIPAERILLVLVGLFTSKLRTDDAAAIVFANRLGEFVTAQYITLGPQTIEVQSKLSGSMTLMYDRDINRIDSTSIDPTPTHNGPKSIN